MNKKAKNKVFLLIMIIALMSFVGCRSNNETSANGEKETQSQVATEVVSVEEKELTKEELLFGDVKICGHKINFPCKVKDLPEGFSIKDGVVVTTTDGERLARIDLLYKGEEVGDICLYGVDKDNGGFYDFSSGYEDYYIRVFDIVGDLFSIRGITWDSSKEELTQKFGVANTERGEDYLIYQIEGERKRELEFVYDIFNKGKFRIVIYYWED